MEVQVNTENSKSVFRYIEIEFNWTLESDYSKFSQWLSCNQNDNFFDRFSKKYGHFKTVILVNYGPFRVKHDDINIVEVLNNYGNEGWEITNTRSSDLIFPPNYDLEDSDRRNSLYYSRNTIYSLKKFMTKQESIIYTVKLKELQEEVKNSNEYSDDDSNEMSNPEFTKLDNLDDSVMQSDPTPEEKAKISLIKQIKAGEKNLSGADLSGAKLYDADLSEADLNEADLRWTDLSEADLSSANLRGAYLSGADLRYADLRWANLREATLIEVDLIGADLREATLIGANLIGANLRYADLSEADLSEADLGNTDIENATVLEAIFGNNQGMDEALKAVLIENGAIFKDETND